MSNSPTDGDYVGHISPDSIHIDDDAWVLISMDEDWLTWEAPLERFHDGRVMYVRKREPRYVDALLAANKASLDESETQKTRFGGDKSVLARKVASIPLNVLFDPRHQLAEKIKEGDRDHMKWWLNRDEARPWRSFRGKV
jgi:hypothetical protein